MHRNAPLTPEGRLRLCQRIESGWMVAVAAESMGISRQCAHKWWRRYRDEGVAGLQDRSSRPLSCPHQTPARLERRIVALRQSRKLGPARLAGIVGVPASTVHRVLVRHGINQLRWMDRPTGRLVRRIETQHPGELVHIDVKKLARIPEGGGWKALGRQQRETTRNRKTKIGYDYVHCLVDDHSRLAYAEVLPDEKGPTCAAFLQRAAGYFAEHGIARIERLMTDNAWAYKYSLREVCADLGIRQKFIKPHCPWQNGKAERFNRTLQTEWAYRRPYTTNTHRTQALTPWLEHYNHHRAHTALGGHPPITRALSPT